MTPERRKLIRRAFEQALKMAPARRSAYLEEEFAGDSELRLSASMATPITTSPA